MIKFFRKIRQNLIMDNKTSKYFKYAIGEIILDRVEQLEAGLSATRTLLKKRWLHLKHIW
jgi:hypothetical protein